jgi:hypothetical protein
MNEGVAEEIDKIVVGGRVAFAFQKVKLVGWGILVAPGGQGSLEALAPLEIDQAVEGRATKEGAQGADAIVSFEERGPVAEAPKTVAEDVRGEILGLGGRGASFDQYGLDPATHLVAPNFGASGGVSSECVVDEFEIQFVGHLSECSKDSGRNQGLGSMDRVISLL